MSGKKDDKGFLKSIHQIDGDERNGFKFRIYLPDPETGKLRQVTRQSEHWTYFDAEKEYLMMEYMGANYFIKNNKKERLTPTRRDVEGKKLLTLDSVFQIYLKSLKSIRRDSYLDTLRINYNAHIKEGFQYFYIQAINQTVVDNWLIALNEKYVKYSTSKNLETHTKNQIIAIVRSIWAFALEKGYITTPLKISRIKEPKIRNATRARPHWKHGDWYKFLESIPSEKVSERALFLLLLSTGARISEIRSTREAAFDFSTNEITIANNLIRRKLESGKTTYKIGHTKGYDTRIIELDKYVIETIKKLIKIRKEEAGRDYSSKETFLFSINGQDPISPMSAQRRFNEYKKIAVAKYPELNSRVTIHGLRHSVGTFIANNIGVVNARDMLGHANLATTSGYVGASDNSETAKKIGSLFTKNE